MAELLNSPTFWSTFGVGFIAFIRWIVEVVLRRGDTRQQKQFEHDANVLKQMQKAIDELQAATVDIKAVSLAHAQSLSELSTNVVSYTKDSSIRADKADTRFNKLTELVLAAHKKVTAKIEQIETEVVEMTDVFRFVKTKLEGRVKP